MMVFGCLGREARSDLGMRKKTASGSGRGATF